MGGFDIQRDTDVSEDQALCTCMCSATFRVMTTTEAMNGPDTGSSLHSPAPTPRSTPPPRSKSEPKPAADPSITIDPDVAADLRALAKLHKRRIRDIVRVGAILAAEHLGEPEVTVDGATWAERMARGDR